MHRTHENIFKITSTIQDELIDYCKENRCRTLSFIPSLAAEIADCAGFEAMFLFINEHGGKKIYLPATNEIFHEKYSLSLDNRNYEKIKKIARTNNQLDIPSSWGLFLAIRRCAIYSALDNGWPTANVIKIFGVTQRQLSSIARSIKNEP